MAHQAFDDLTDIYESLVDWPKRLAREAPFYRRLFADHEVLRVVDVACGTGHHASMFHQWGQHVEGSDLSPAMIDRARRNFGEPPGLRWTVRGFENPLPQETPADAVVCVGNSLALAADDSHAKQAVQQMLRAVRPGGIVVLHLLNLWSLPDGPCVWQKSIQCQWAGTTTLVTKGVHRNGSQGYVDLLISTLDPPALLDSRSVALLGLTDVQIDDWARDAGAASMRVLGDYQLAPYQPHQSADMIVIIERESGR